MVVPSARILSEFLKSEISFNQLLAVQCTKRIYVHAWCKQIKSQTALGLVVSDSKAHK